MKWNIEVLVNVGKLMREKDILRTGGGDGRNKVAKNKN